jgi:hypothetical protein
MEPSSSEITLYWLDFVKPFTLGYVMTQQKPTAQVLLIAETGDPLLAVSRFGLGTGMAYTSDLSERWGGEWLAWGDCGKFWGQVLRGIIRKQDSEGIHLMSEVVDQQWNLTIQKRSSAGQPQNKIDWELMTIDELGNQSQFPVRETGLGQYRSSIPLGEHQRLSIRLRNLHSDQMQVLHYDRPYPNEYNLSRKLPQSIGSLARFEPAEIRDELIEEKTRQSIAHYFYYAALACILLGIIFRRI